MSSLAPLSFLRGGPLPSKAAPWSAKEALRRFLPTRPRNCRVLGGSLRGARIYTSWHDYPGAVLGTTEGPLLDWFRGNVRAGETWIDVGAHYGYTAICLARLVGKQGRVFAFEPVLSTAGCVAKTRELNGLYQITVVPMGLSEGPAVQTQVLPTVRGMADSTIPSLGVDERILVTSFDFLWPSLSGGCPVVHGVKVDVQGMEIGVLEGMRLALTQHRPVLVVELHGGVSREAIRQLLRSYGYDGAGEPIEPDEDPRQPAYSDNRSYVFRARQ